VKRGSRERRTQRRTMVTGYEVDVQAVATAMLRDEGARRLLVGGSWFTAGARSRGDRPHHPRG